MLSFFVSCRHSTVIELAFNENTLHLYFVVINSLCT
ncbi:hypothetical protein XMM312_000223 [Marinobacterium sp. xm-m-312]|nr:hypothetical protein [Marinobacterium sp. xm-d-543]NRQ22555.1 hypothetical protein [Marinobacterium sp. xm-m-312]